MPFCDNCGQQIDEKQKFCPHCGARNEVAFQSQATQASPPPPGQKIEVSAPKKVIDIEVDQQDIDQAKEKAKHGLSAAFGFAKRGLSKGAEIAGKGIEAARCLVAEMCGLLS